MRRRESHLPQAQPAPPHRPAAHELIAIQWQRCGSPPAPLLAHAGDATRPRPAQLGNGTRTRRDASESACAPRVPARQYSYPLQQLLPGCRHSHRDVQAIARHFSSRRRHPRRGDCPLRRPIIDVKTPILVHPLAELHAIGFPLSMLGAAKNVCALSQLCGSRSRARPAPVGTSRAATRRDPLPAAAVTGAQSLQLRVHPAAWDTPLPWRPMRPCALGTTSCARRWALGRLGK